MAGPSPAKSYSLSNCAAFVSSNLHDRAAILFAWPNQKGISARKSIQLFLYIFLFFCSFPTQISQLIKPMVSYEHIKSLCNSRKKKSVFRDEKCILMLICWSNSRATKGRELKIPGTSLPASKQEMDGEVWWRLSAWS